MRKTPPVPKKLNGEQEAHLIAICCSQAPQGRARWTLSLLVNELKERGIVTEISRETVRQALKKPVTTLEKTTLLHCPKGFSPFCRSFWRWY